MKFRMMKGTAHDTLVLHLPLLTEMWYTISVLGERREIYMCMMLDVPPAIEAQVGDYEKAVGKSIQQALLDYIQREFARVREGRERVNRFRSVLSRQPRLTGAPYVFRRQDAYEEELA